MSLDPRTRLIDRIAAPILEEIAPLASGRLIDIGCGNKPLESVFAPYVDAHVGVDHELTLHDLSRADLIGAAYDLPVEDGSFDTVLCTAVLEHLEEPAAALREARRVLRDGGLAIYSMPFIWHIHEAPRDFYRYSRYGLEHLFTQAGFEIEEIRALSGFWVTFGTEFAYYLHTLRRGRILSRLIPAFSVVMLEIAGRLDRLHRAEEWTWAYLVLARAAPRS